MNPQLLELIAVFGYLSLLTVGGGMAAFPELKTLTVDVHQWVTAQELIHFYSVGQMAPGPNMMMVTAIGERVAGAMGALVVVIAFFMPTGLITFGVGRLWIRLEGWPWRDALQQGLAPVSVGLILAGSISMAKEVLADGLAIAIAAAVLGLLLRTRINPALLILGGALIGAIAFVSR